MIAPGARPLYADCNVISLATSSWVGAEIEKVDASYTDAGIIGINPVRAKGGNRFCVSGPDTVPTEALVRKGAIVCLLGPGSAVPRR